MRLRSAKLGDLRVEPDAFASGGAGDVHRARDPIGNAWCVKIWTKARASDKEKVAFLCGERFSAVREAAGWGLLSWPYDTLVDGSGEIRGFVMPIASADSVDFSHLTALNWPGSSAGALEAKLQRHTSEGMRRRLLVGCNLAAAVKAAHEAGCVLVDLKPQNILVGTGGQVTMVDLDSVQVRDRGTLYPGPLGSPEYMPPESYRMNFDKPPQIRPDWDYFSLAVIYYELLLGIHPYAGTAKPSVLGCETMEDSIRLRLYANGINRGDLEVIPPPHAFLAQLPGELPELFRKAFDSTKTSDRPTAEQWGIALHAAASGAVSALPATIYDRRHKRQPTRIAVPVGSPQAASAGRQLCFGPIGGGSCAQRAYGVANRSVPGLANHVFICDACMQLTQKRAANLGVGEEHCWGPVGGGACAYRSKGLPTIHIPGRSGKVYICSACIALSNSGMLAGATGVPPQPTKQPMPAMCYGPIGGAVCPVAPRPVGLPNYPHPNGSSERIFLCGLCEMSAKPATCWGPVGGGLCPHGAARSGMPNADHPSLAGHRIYLCQDCQRSSVKNSTKPIPCWGPLSGGGCRHGTLLTGVPNTDHPKIPGQRVYLCLFCSGDGASRSTTGSSANAGKTDGCLSMIALVIGSSAALTLLVRQILA